MEIEGVFPSHQYVYRKERLTCDAMLDIVCARQVALDRRREFAVLQIDFSAVFDRESHTGIHY